MCTLSWSLAAPERVIVFNRDEQRSRSPALPPRQWVSDRQAVLAPLDPDGGGTWIGANGAGLAVALLNHYPHTGDVGAAARSRGLLVREALETANDVDGVDALLRESDLQRYRGFLLFALGVDGEPGLWRWDGGVLESVSTEAGMVSTSSVRAEACERYRRTLFEEAGSFERRLAAHWRYCEADPALGPMMRRDDARTQSVVALRLRPDEVELSYTGVKDGEPPSAGPETRKAMRIGGRD